MVKGLGKGIGALFPNEPEMDESKVQQIAIQKLIANPYQPRKTFNEETLEELAASIREHGIIQPIIARKKGKSFEIVAGERRYRAAKIAELEEIPVIVQEMDDQRMMEIAILENLQREDLTPIEEAEAYQNLIEQLHFKQEDLASRLGKSRPYIANHIRLLQLPDDVRTLVNDGTLSMGHGRTLLSLKNKKLIPEVAKKVVLNRLNVRQLEALVQSINEDVPRETKKIPRDIFVESKEEQLRDYFGTHVQIKKQKDKGKIEIEFYSSEDLERILEILQLEQE